MLNETVYLAKESSKMDRFPAYMDQSMVKERLGLRRLLIMQFIDKSLKEYVTEKYQS
jgi:hypothetical protein